MMTLIAITVRAAKALARTGWRFLPCNYLIC
jgi:hypothetical protein